MKETSLQAIIDTFRTFVHKKGWSITEEKVIAHGYQLTVTDGIAKTPVALYSSGKALVQGKPNTLQTELKKWVYGSLARPGSRDKVPSTQLQFFDNESTAAETGTFSTKRQATGLARIGSDESGKGDYFGPLVIAAVYVDKQTEEQLITLGIRDSKLVTDHNVTLLSQEIKALCRGHGTILIYSPEQYNELYEKTGNLNILLARAHAQVITKIAKITESKLAIVDQFGDESLVHNTLARTGCTIAVEKRPHAEGDTAVAAASIVARAEFIKQLRILSHHTDQDLPKGASNPQIVTVGREIVAKGGREALRKVAKLHFNTTETILQDNTVSYI
jgi:ribonuclease HIII